MDGTGISRTSSPDAPVPLVTAPQTLSNRLPHMVHLHLLNETDV